MSGNSAPGYMKYPQHRITTKPAGLRVRVAFNGEASYFSLKNGPENAVWSYERPYDESMAIKELLAFYPDKVDAITASGG
jgi:uncharacterized protein (DUF427 family)